MKQVHLLSLIAIISIFITTGCLSTQHDIEIKDTKETINSNTTETVIQASETIPEDSSIWTKPTIIKYDILDSHINYFDYIQTTDGFYSLDSQMKTAGVSKAVVFGMPVVKQWDNHSGSIPTHYLSNDSRLYYYSATDYQLLHEYENLPVEIKQNFFPFVCGINPNDKYAAEYLRKLFDLYPEQIYGIGEIIIHHDDVTALTYGEAPHADSESMLKIYDLAAEKCVPIIIHNNLAGSYMNNPIYQQELKNALSHNRNADIILAHGGISRRVELDGLPGILDTLLWENPNLYIDLSWLIFDDYIANDEKNLRRWVLLIQDYPNRFMIGSDILGHWNGYSDKILKYYSFLDLLQPEVAKKVAKENMLSLIFK